MAATTTYDVKLRYALEDRATRGMRGLGREARTAARSTGMLRSAILRAGAAAAGFFTLRLAKRSLIDYNSALDQARITTEGLLSMNMGGTFARNQERANFLVRRFRDDSKASVGTMKDFVDMSGLIAGPLSRGGASVKNIADVTKGAVISARAFGVEADVAARDIEQAMAGTLGMKDRFARALLEPMGITTKKWNEMVRSGSGDAAAMLVRAFNQPAIVQMAERQRTSFAGVTSTLQDNLERALGKVGLPLMQRLTAEAQRLNRWFEKNPERIAQMAKTLGDSLVSGFNAMKSGLEMLNRNRGLLTLLAKAWLIKRGVGGLVGMGLDAHRMLGGFGEGLSKVNPKLGVLAGKLGVLSAGVLGAIGLIKLAERSMMERQEKRITQQAGSAFMLAQLAGLRGEGPANVRRGAAVIGAARQMSTDEVLAQRALQAARGAGFNRDFGPRKLASVFGGGQAQLVGAGLAGKGPQSLEAWITGLESSLANDRNKRFHDAQKQQLEFLRGLQHAMVVERQGLFSGLRMIYDMHQDDMLGALGNLGEALWTRFTGRGVGKDKGSGKRDTNVTIQRIEVVSDDPDRFAMDLVGAFDRFASSPSQARGALRES